MEEKTYKVQEIFNWYKKYNKTDILIKGKNKEFYIEINNKALPHLLGLQYINSNKNDVAVLKGRRLYNYIEYNKFSDQEIYKLVFLNNEDRLNDVVNRINTFKEFMENLEQGYILEQTNPYTQIKSNYLIVQNKENLFLHLGIKEGIVEETLTEYRVDDQTKDILETYFAREDMNYFENSKIFEKVESIEKYDEKEKDYIPFSFNEVKNQELLQKFHKEKEENKKALIELATDIVSKGINENNYNALTGNRIIIKDHSSGKKRWIAATDVRNRNISIKENEKTTTSIVLFAEKGKDNPSLSKIEYYNLSQLKITKELEQKFVPMKEKEKKVEKAKDMGIER